MNKIICLTFSWILIAEAVSAQVTMERERGGILVSEGGQKVLFYQMEPKSIQGKYERRHYIHPLWSLNGNILTEDFPDDHLHHRGIFWAWHRVRIGNQLVGDPWELIDFEQRITDAEIHSEKDGSGAIHTRVEWLSDQWRTTEAKKPYLEEKSTVIIHPKKNNYRRIDFTISLLALEENLQIGGSDDEKGYSGFSVRMKLPADIQFNGPHGNVMPLNTAVESRGYIQMEGSISTFGEKEGIVIFDHRGNPGFPQSWILRNKNSMQNAVFPGNKLLPISTTQPLVLNYSLLVYSGEITEQEIFRNLENR